MSQIQAIHTLLSGIKNGQKSRLSEIHIKNSTLSYDILNVLYDEGYIVNFCKDKDTYNNDIIRIKLKYHSNVPAIRNIKKISNTHVSLKLLNYIDSGLITYILSTSRGIISGKEARRLGIGGALLFVIW